MEKHAYLIMTYGNLYTLSKCVQLLDDARNDIFIHCDKKMGDISEIAQKLKNLVKRSNIHFINRRDVFWADISQTEAEIDLLEAASHRGGMNTIIF